jgi:hypothetical protein
MSCGVVWPDSTVMSGHERMRSAMLRLGRRVEDGRAKSWLATLWCGMAGPARPSGCRPPSLGSICLALAVSICLDHAVEMRPGTPRSGEVSLGR